MVDRNLILIKIDKIREYLTFLKGIKKYSKNEYINDPYIYGSTERFVQLGIEVAIDIGNHLSQICGSVNRKTTGRSSKFWRKIR